MTEYKQLCAELVEQLDNALDFTVSSETQRYMKLLTRKARVALAEPEPEGPTGEELLSLEQLRDTWNAQADAANSWDELGVDEIIWWAQRQALARWGHPAPQPATEDSSAVQPADGEVTELATAEMARQLRTKAATEKANRCHYSAKLLTRAADLLERQHTQPVPASERLPGPGDCDVEGRCWWGRSESGDWSADWTLATHKSIVEFCEFTPRRVWLPAHALPLPQPS